MATASTANPTALAVNIRPPSVLWMYAVATVSPTTPRRVATKAVLGRVERDIGADLLDLAGRPGRPPVPAVSVSSGALRHRETAVAGGEERMALAPPRGDARVGRTAARNAAECGRDTRRMSTGAPRFLSYPRATVTSTERLPMPAAEARPQRREAILQSSVDEAVRLAGATGGLIFLRDEESGGLRFAVGAGIRAEQVRAWEASLRDTTDRDGILVRAMATGRTVSTGDYLADVTFGRPATGEAAARRLGIRSVVAAPLAIDAVPAGVLAVYSARVEAFGEREVALIRALADHAAAAVANAGLIEALGRSRAELARRAAAERALREIVSRFTGLTDSPALLQHVVDEANRLVGGDGGILDVLEPETGVLAWAYDATLSDRFSAAQIADYTLPIGVGLTGRAVAERRVLSAGDDLVAEFPASPASDRFFEVTGFRSMIAAPIATEDGPLGALEVYSTRPHAFDADDLALVGALADHAAIALSAARRVEDLARSRAEIARRAEVERTLRQIAA